MKIESKNIVPPDECTNIEEIRAQIDSLDQMIVKALGYRYLFVKEVVKYKNKDYQSIKAQNRYDAVIQKRREWAVENGLNPAVVEEMYKMLIHHFIDEEMKIISSNKEH